MEEKKIEDVQIKQAGLIWLTVSPMDGSCMCAYTSKELAVTSYEVKVLGYLVESRFLRDFTI